MRTVLILAHQCHPFERRESIMGAQRAYQFAKWLPDFGWRAEVLCCPADPTRTEPTVVGPSVITPVQPARDAGALDRWWRSLTAASSVPARLVRRALTLALLPSGDWSRAWREPARRIALERVRAGERGDLPRVNVLMGEHGPDAGLWAARDVARATGVPWVMDFRDSVLATWPIGLSRTLIRPGLRLMLRGVRATVNVNPHWAEIDGALSQAPAFVIPNGYDPDAAFVSRPADRFSVVIYGSLRQSHRLDILVDCLTVLRARYRLTADTFELAYFGLQGEKLAAIAASKGVDDLVRPAGFVARADLLRTVAAAQAVVVPTIDPSIEREPLFRKGCVHGKMIEVLPLGTPIVFVPGDQGYADDLLRRTNAGVVAADTEGLAAVLGNWFDRWQHGLPYGPTPVKREVERLSRREGARNLSQLLDQVVTGAAITPYSTTAGA